MRKWLTALVAVLIVLSAGGAPPAAASLRDGVNWLTMSDEYTVVYYGPGFAADAQQVLTWMQEARAINQRVLGATVSGQAKVRLVPSFAAWGRNPTDMFTEPATGEIWALTPSLIPQAERLLYPNVLTHEFVHLVTFEIRPNWEETPLWFSEGLAEYVSLWGSGHPEWIEAYPWYEALMRRAAREGGLSGVAPGEQYINGSQAVRFMFETFGKEKMQQLVRTNSGDIRADIEQVLGVTWGDLHDAWLRWASMTWQVPMSEVTGDPTAGGIVRPQVVTAEIPRTVYQPVVRSIPIPTPEPVQITLQSSSRRYRVGREVRPLAGKPRAQEGELMVPLDLLAEALGAEVGWSAATGEITILYPPAGVAGAGPDGAGSGPDTGEAAATTEGTRATDGAVYIHVPERFVYTHSSGVPALQVQAGTISPLSVEELDMVMEAPRHTLLRFQFELTVPRNEDSNAYMGILLLEIPMVREPDGGYRSQWPVVIRPHPEVHFKVVLPGRGPVDPEWTFTPTP